MKILTRTLFLCLMLVPATRAAQATEPHTKRYDLAYQVYIGGLRLLTAEMHITQAKPQYYEIEVNARTSGLARLLTQWTGTISANGIYKDGVPQPIFYESHSKWPHNTITKRFTYDENGMLTALSIEDQEAPDKEPQPLTLGHNSRDLLSALYYFAEQAATGQNCAGESIVFDGTRRFLLTQSHDGRENLRQSRYNSFSGPAVLCRYQMTPQGGRWQDNLVGWMAGFYGARTQNDSPAVWYGTPQSDDSDMLALPVKLRAKVKYGTAFVHVTDIRVTDSLQDLIEPAGGPEYGQQPDKAGATP